MSAAESKVVRITRPALTDFEKQQALLGLKGIFAALDWLEEGALRSTYEEKEIDDARSELITAGVALTTAICGGF